MKCLSLWQPWASLVAAGLKTIETRDWPTRYRGPLAIHAAKRRMSGEEKALLYTWACKGMVPAAWLDSEPLPYGAILAVVELRDCVCTEEAVLHAGMSRAEEAFGNYAPGRWAWFTQDVRRLAEPFPYRGTQGLFDAQFPQPDIADAIAPAVAHVTRRCRICGCTDSDCRRCIAKTGKACHWVAPDLCSACAPAAPT